MTRDEALARANGYLNSVATRDSAIALADLLQAVAAEEREACARVCEPTLTCDIELMSYGSFFAGRIRARGCDR